MNNKKNIISALVNQGITIVYGLVLPRLIIVVFGSEINGMVSSISQFLSFISLLEGGLGAVILAELYLPIEQNNDTKIKGILYASKSFFTKLGMIFLGYTVVVAIIYSYSVKDRYNTLSIALLVFVLSLSTLSQYLFAITSKLLLQAQQKIYIVNNVSSITLILNIIIAFVTIKIYPSIILLKFCSAIMFLIQPLIFNNYIEKKYRTFNREFAKYTLKNRWSGFGQNLAHFINMNTDIAILSVFVSLREVSVYSIYLLAINALRSLIMALDNSFQSSLGKCYAERDIEKLGNNFKRFNSMNALITFTFFNTCLLLINPFVQLYTDGVKDANYYRPVFALIMVLANIVFCLREPLRSIVLATGKFKETNFGAYIEAAVNIIVSLILVHYMGIVGVAIGTFVAILIRMIYFYYFLHKDILFLDLRYYFKINLKYLIIIIINILGYAFIPIHCDSAINFCLYGAAIFIIEIIISTIFLGEIKVVLSLLKICKYNENE